MKPIEERLRETLDERSAGRPAPPDLAERAERRGRRVRRRRAGGAALAVASAASAVVLGTTWAAPEHAGRVAAAPSPDVTPGPTDTVGRGQGAISCLASVRTSHNREADARLVVNECSERDAARSVAALIQRCPHLKDGIDTSEPGRITVTGRDLSCALKVFNMELPPKPR